MNHRETLVFIQGILIDLRDRHVGYDTKALAEMLAIVKAKIT